jgi:hypothetical protein
MTWRVEARSLENRKFGTSEIYMAYRVGRVFIQLKKSYKKKQLRPPRKKKKRGKKP